jgi:L-lactate dehydrogenase complex protein LldF
MHQLSSETFKENAVAALNDAQLRGALSNLADTFGKHRHNAINSVDDWEGLRDRARSIKDEILLHLDTYLDQFSRNAEAAGAKVHWAVDGKDACQIVHRIINETDGVNIVKSKSMVTEEIGLNHSLEAFALEPVETDLGEWIIQLAEETPSHIVVPAIHKTKRQIADLFAEKLGIERTEDVDALTATARIFLRERFAAADVGISGVNFGVASTGTIMIIENEGNIRLTTSLPRVHIAVMGIEKLVPELGDLDVFLKLLPRSATGQRLTAYQSLLTGTKRHPRDEGPEDLHIVLLDNGRSRMLADPVTRQSLACIRCGACLNACPVYQKVGGHAYGSVYPGPIGAVITPQLLGLSRTKQLPYASSLCGACREVCPVKIDIPALLLHLRSEIAEGVDGSDGPQSGRAAERFAFRLYGFLWTRPWAYRVGIKLGRLMQKFVTRGERIGRIGTVPSFLAPPVAAWTATRDAPPIAKRSFHQVWKEDLWDE